MKIICNTIQIFIGIKPIFSENFIQINQVWPQLQPQMWSEVIFRIYTSLDHFYHWQPPKWVKKISMFKNPILYTFFWRFIRLDKTVTLDKIAFKVAWNCVFEPWFFLISLVDIDIRHRQNSIQKRKNLAKIKLIHFLKRIKIWIKNKRRPKK